SDHERVVQEARGAELLQRIRDGPARAPEVGEDLRHAAEVRILEDLEAGGRVGIGLVRREERPAGPYDAGTVEQVGRRAKVGVATQKPDPAGFPAAEYLAVEGQPVAGELVAGDEAAADDADVRVAFGESDHALEALRVDPVVGLDDLA